MWRKSLEDWLSTTSLSGFNQLYIEQLYEQYTLDNNAVDKQWAALFRDLEAGSLTTANDYQKLLSAKDTGKLWKLINSYRNHGHLIANIDPLNKWKRNPGNHFNLIDFELHPDETFQLPEKICGLEQTSVATLYEKLQETYTATIGYEFGHINDSKVVAWFTDQIENHPYQATSAEKLAILERLVRAEELEKTIAAKFPGAKRFSLEGNESYVNLIDKLLEIASDNNYRDVYLSMAHRGRLNLLVNHCALPSGELFDMFSGKAPLDDQLFANDVKYHMGQSVRYEKVVPVFNSNNLLEQATGKSNTSYFNFHLLYNPSHLEFVGSVLLGAARAKQQQYNFSAKIDAQDLRNHYNLSVATSLVLPIMVHGDSAVSGQGIIQEILNMSNTRAYSVGGTIHIVINNQIGFTTNRLDDMRSSTYCTDVAKMTNCPIIHVNAQDPVAVVRAASLAFAYRQTFKKDIFIDLVGYRRLGHNEADDPSITQPVMYQQIKQQQLISSYYAQQLEQEGIYNVANLASLRQQVAEQLLTGNYQNHFAGFVNPQRYNAQDDFGRSPMTLAGRELPKFDPSKHQLTPASQVASAIFTLDANTPASPGLLNLYKRRAQLAQAEVQEDGIYQWGDAELLAYGQLVAQGIKVRLTGEDAGRGTFFHRGAVLHSTTSEGQELIPLQDYAQEHGGRFEVFDSTLSEAAVLGFEYGYAMVNLNDLVIWEAQFGDFANGAQVLIDQFISSAETKWDQLSKLVLLLPHGYEGAGPEHSSARIERFMQLAANNNMRVVYPTNSLQMYRLLLDHALNNYHKPLIVFTPKSLLRLPAAQAKASELTGASSNPTTGLASSSATGLNNGSGNTSGNGSSNNLSNNTNLSFNNHFNNLYPVSYYYQRNPTGDLSAQQQAYANLTPEQAQSAREQVTTLVLSTGKIFYDAEPILRDKAHVALVSIEQLYPLAQNELIELINSYPNLNRVLYLQDEPQNQGFLPYFQTYWYNQLILQCNKNRLFLETVSRPASATTAVGYGRKHKEELDTILAVLRNC